MSWGFFHKSRNNSQRKCNAVPGELKTKFTTLKNLTFGAGYEMVCFWSFAKCRYSKTISLFWWHQTWYSNVRFCVLIYLTYFSTFCKSALTGYVTYPHSQKPLTKLGRELYYVWPLCFISLSVCDIFCTVHTQQSDLSIADVLAWTSKTTFKKKNLNVDLSVHWTENASKVFACLWPKMLG